MSIKPRHEEAMRRLEASHEIVVDVETSGLSWQKNHIVGFVLTFGPRDEDSYYLPFRHAGQGNIEGVNVPQDKEGWDGTTHVMEREIAVQLSRPDKLLVFHHGAFDLKFLHRIGVKLDAKMEDTMINAALLDEYQSSFTLDFCCKQMRVAQKKTSIYDYLMQKFPEIQAAPKTAMGHYWRLAGDDPEAVTYAEADGVATYQLVHAQRPVIVRDGLTRVHDIECRLIPVLARMMVRGVKIDIERLHEVKKIIEERLVEAQRALPADFNSRAPTQVRALMEKHGHTDWPLTPKGQPSFPEVWLESNPIGKKIVGLRKYNNILSSFIGPMLDTHLWNGRVYPSYNQLRNDDFGTVTGRLSSSAPNLQQSPKRNREISELYRSVFVPDEGKIWCTSDMSQAEPRLLGYYARCKVLIDGYNADPPVDAHQAVATAAGVDRELGKRLNQTIITGGGRKVLTTRYGIPPAKVDEIWPKYFAAMPELKPFQYKAADVFKSRGYVMSILGRRARLRDHSKAYTAVNRLLQMSNSDWIKTAMVLIDEYLRSEGDKVYIANSVHDSLDFIFAEEDRPILKRCLELFVDLRPILEIDVPMLVESGEGRSWSEATWGA